jgi:hypothetical protein
VEDICAKLFQNSSKYDKVTFWTQMEVGTHRKCDFNMAPFGGITNFKATPGVKITSPAGAKRCIDSSYSLI